MSKFTAAELVEFYQKVADGGVMECVDHDGIFRAFRSSDFGPVLGGNVDRWRIKPAKKIIDMTHFIKSGIDCEFSDDHNFFNIWVGKLTGGSGLDFHRYSCDSGDGHRRHAKYCRPRMDRTHYYDGGECPLPEGFKVRFYFRGQSSAECTNYTMFTWFHRYTQVDIIGYEIIGLVDGWAYPWECEE